MDDNRTQSDTEADDKNMKAVLPLTAEDVRLIKNSFSRKRKIVYYFMAALITIGTVVSLIAIYDETSSVNRLNSIAVANGEQAYFTVYYPELLIPFFIGTGIALVLILVLIMFNQELNIELNNNRKCIYKGVVTKRSEKATRLGVGDNRETYYDNYIYLGDICFEHKELYFEISEGDRIDVQISERLNIILHKNITKNKTVARLTPEKIGEAGHFDIVRGGQDVAKHTAPMTGDELEALVNLKQKRFKKILPVAVIFTLGLGITSEIILATGSYMLDEIIAMRGGLWGGPAAFFGLLLYWKVNLLSKDIRSGEKLIISEKVTDKEEYTWASTQKTSYYIKGLSEKTEVSKEVFDSLTAGDDYELHKTKLREIFLALVNPGAGMKYRNPDFF